MSAGFYGTSSCTACTGNAATCSGSTAPTTCLPGYFLLAGTPNTCALCSAAGSVAATGNTCIANGYYLATSSATVYTACATGALLCAATTGVPSSCATGYYLGLVGTAIGCIACGVSNAVSCSPGNVPTACVSAYVL